jgi:hypothetical protein
MNILSDAELANIASRSKLVTKYAQKIDGDSAYELLNAKLQHASENQPVESKKGKTAKPELTSVEKSIK